MTYPGLLRRGLSNGVAAVAVERAQKVRWSARTSGTRDESRILANFEDGCR